VPPDEARQRAQRQFGNPLATRETSHDIKMAPRLEAILLDIVFGLRLYRRHKAVTGAALVSLSLAIGACTAAFSLIDALILRPLPVDDPHSLIYIAYRAPSAPRDALSFNYPLFARLRDSGRGQVRLFAMSDQSRLDATFDESAQPEKVYGQWISGDALAVLGVKPVLGRLLTPSDDVNPGQHPVAVLSHDFWTRRFGQSPSVLGRWLTIRGKSLQVVGVAEHGFTGTEPGIMIDVWAPTMMWDDRAITDPSTRWFRVWGRLQPGVSESVARAVLQPVFTNFRREQAAMRSADSVERRADAINTRIFLRSAVRGPSALREDFARPLWVLACVALLVLLIACSNVASLLVARACARAREMALRVSIGAGRGRLIQQVLIESALLSLAACAGGALIAAAAAPRVVSMLSTSQTTVRLDLQFDWRLLVFLTAAGFASTLLFGLPPALRASAVSPHDALKSGSTKHTGRIGVFRPLVAAQTAFGFVVLFVAALCLMSFGKLVRIDLGFDQNHLIVAAVQRTAMADDVVMSPAGWEQLVERLGQVPGIESASLSGWNLFVGTGRNKSVRITAQPVDAYDPWYLPVSPGFLKTLGIRLVEGRDFEWRDARPPLRSAVIVNQSFARRYFPGESALGKRFFRVDGGATLVAQDIVGVVTDAKYTDLREAAPPTVYDPFAPAGSAAVQLRTQLDLGTVASMLLEALRRADPAFRLTDITQQSTLVANFVVRDRLLALLSAFFSVVAMVLVAVGLYAVVSYSVVQRTREIGIRLALGAAPARVIRLVISEVGIVSTVGLIVGAVGSLAAARFMSALLYDVSPSAPSNLAAPLVCLTAASALSALVPALRATRVDPATTLRAE
jgi:predicted permease